MQPVDLVQSWLQYNQNMAAAAQQKRQIFMQEAMQRIALAAQANQSDLERQQQMDVLAKQQAFQGTQDQAGRDLTKQLDEMRMKQAADQWQQDYGLKQQSMISEDAYRKSLIKSEQDKIALENARLDAQQNKYDQTQQKQNEWQLQSSVNSLKLQAAEHNADISGLEQVSTVDEQGKPLSNLEFLQKQQDFLVKQLGSAVGKVAAQKEVDKAQQEAERRAALSAGRGTYNPDLTPNLPQEVKSTYSDISQGVVNEKIKKSEVEVDKAFYEYTNPKSTAVLTDSARKELDNVKVPGANPLDYGKNPGEVVTQGDMFRKREASLQDSVTSTYPSELYGRYPALIDKDTGEPKILKKKDIALIKGDLNREPNKLVKEMKTKVIDGLIQESKIKENLQSQYAPTQTWIGKSIDKYGNLWLSQTKESPSTIRTENARQLFDIDLARAEKDKDKPNWYNKPGNKWINWYEEVGIHKVK